MYYQVIADKELILKHITNIPDKDLKDCILQSKKILDHLAGEFIGDEKSGNFYVPPENLIQASGIFQRNKKKKESSLKL